MPKKFNPIAKPGEPAPLRAPHLPKPAGKRPDLRNSGRPVNRGRPAGGRPQRFPGRTGGR